MPRPEPPPLRADDDGYHWEAQIAPRWRLHDRGMRCRQTGPPATGQGRRCRTVATMELNRSMRAGRELWWAYCAEHAFGRRVEDGQVYEWILVADEVSHG